MRNGGMITNFRLRM